jgi:HlyD family secretion protein
LELDYYNNKIESTEKQIKDFKIYYNRLWEQRNMKEQELKIAEMQFERDKKLFEKNVYSKSDYEKAEKTYLQEKLSFENIRSTLANTQMQINQLDQQILDLQLQKSKEEQSQVIALEESAQNLNTQIKQWKLRYLIIAPISGNVTFTKIWSENQNVQTGEIVATIIPNEATNIIGKVAIPSAGVGKVKEGQTVNIKLNNFPYMEFGILKGTIRNISLVPIQSENGAIYTAEVELSDSLISNYGKQLKFSQQMTGTAEIITDDLRLLERFFNPLKAIWKKNVE